MGLWAASVKASALGRLFKAFRESDTTSALSRPGLWAVSKGGARDSKNEDVPLLSN